jgi:gas vesicle protein
VTEREHAGGQAATILVAFTLGAITGAALALLWAPVAGDEARRFLGDKAREGRERAGEAASKGREFVQKQREHVSSAIERGKEAYQQARPPKEPV